MQLPHLLQAVRSNLFNWAVPLLVALSFHPAFIDMSLTRHFCCCLPVRLGVFVLSLLSLIGGGIYAGATWYAYYRKCPCQFRS
jgi:hypothetical protein